MKEELVTKCAVLSQKKTEKQKRLDLLMLLLDNLKTEEEENSGLTPNSLV